MLESKEQVALRTSKPAAATPSAESSVLIGLRLIWHLNFASGRVGCMDPLVNDLQFSEDPDLMGFVLDILLLER